MTKLAPHEIFGISLNEPQYDAVTTTDGALLVIAGAGSGKTRVITARMGYLMAHKNVPGSAIVALTFTNKAAREMKERLHSYIGAQKSMPYVGTFHAYALYLLRSNPHLMPFEQFSIFDGDDQLALVKKILKHHGLEKQLNASNVLYQISQLKNSLDIERALLGTNQLIGDIFNAYEKEKALAQALDFDDLLLVLHRIFSTNQVFRSIFQSRIQHILVDEYQDTNVVQHELLKLMSLDAEKKLAVDSICAVGDEDQSVYSWRGANVANMLTFQDDFAPVKKVSIEQNYRSVSPILEAANAVIANNSFRNPKALWSTRAASKRIIAFSCRSEYQEADALVACYKALPASKQSSFAVLYRTHYQSRIIEEALTRSSIPYRIIGGIAFYARKEIKDILAYLRIIANPYDRVSFFRILNTPARGLGAQCEEVLQMGWFNHETLSCHELIEQLMSQQENGMSGKRALALKELSRLLLGYDKTQKASAIISSLVQKIEYLAFLKTQYDAQDAQDKIENIQELIRSAQHFEDIDSAKNIAMHDTSDASMVGFLHAIALLQEKIEHAQEGDAMVTMMTLHAAKGLEFDTVAIVGLEEGLFPSTRNLGDAELLEEERRLFYVGITRAKEHLLLSRAYYRNQFGQINDQPISRFLTEIPTELQHHYDISQQTGFGIRNIFASWIGTRQENPFNKFIPSTKTPVAVKNASEKTTPVSLKTAKNAPWKINQTVVHAKFGVGLVKKIEERNDGSCYITAQFKSGEKKLLSTFVQKV